MRCNLPPEELDRLALQILRYSRQRLSHLAPSLLPALYALRDKCRDTPGPLSTDGKHLFYHPQQVVLDFRKGRDKPALQLIHVTLHCLLDHLPARAEQQNPALLDAAADVRVYQLISALFGSRFYSLARDTLDILFEMEPATDICMSPRTLTACCAALQEEPRAAKALLRHARRYALDDHNLWHKPSFSGQGTESPSVTSGEGTSPSDNSAPPDWDKLLRQIKASMGSADWGTMPDFLTQAVEPASENQISYGSLLRRFAAPREQMRADPDSIDAKWYHLGLALYGDLPILEPCEVCDQPTPDELVIAIDTSGSCSGPVCAHFLRETLNLLRDITGRRPTFRVLLLQCDCQVQQELLLEHSAQLDSFLSDFVPTGFGGTDFSPVFQRVEDLRQEGVFRKVRGLLYLSDGFGHFPDTPPDYPVVFLIPAEENQPIYLEPDFPPWVTVMHLDLEHNTIKEATS